MTDESNLNQNDRSHQPDENVSSGDTGTPPEIESQINARSKIIEILTRVDTRQAYTDKLLEREIDEFNENDRALITEVVNGVLRWRYKLDWIIRQLYVGEFETLIPDVKNNLRSSIYQLIFLDKIPPYAVLNEAVEISKNRYNQKTANLVNAILRNYLRQQKKLEFMELELDYLERLAVTYSHPFWLIQRWIEQWGIDETILLCKANNERPRLSVRLNHLLINKDEFFKTLDEHQIPYEVHPDFPEFVWIDDFSEFRKLDFLKKGWVSVQDVSTGIPVRLLDPRPGEMVLDMCAAPGGKAGYIGEKMQNQGVFLALEKHPNRARLLQDNLTRLGVENAIVVTADALHIPSDKEFDKILLDAPCTGFGVLNKRVDLKWKRTLNDIKNMHDLQLQLLESAAKSLKVGGVLVYSTCTIDVEENEQVVKTFLERFPDFIQDKLTNDLPSGYLWENDAVRTFPHRHHCDGSFAVRLRKVAR
ncbi:MAG: 16S rRNA (cytosine(967)-C(5))-methyltransferase RsmB [Calditrichaeota bacterium]|nr:MAG: 16S rRNA (cytosine(967)-C(5))-methyltransferase RsmB [Calditrichota bacterium]